MKNHQTFSTNNKPDIVAASLISAYNTHVYGTYKNIFSHDDINMSCLILTLQGSAKVTLVNGSDVTLKKNSAFFGRLSSMHSIHSDCSHWHFLCFWFIPHNVSLPINQAFNIKNLSATDQDESASKIIRLLQMNVENKTKYANSYFCYKLLDIMEKINPSTQKSNELTDKIIDYINIHIEEDIKIKDIADKFHYSEKHIRSLFNNTLNISPKQYIIKVKLENVCHLLLNSTLSLQEIAEKYCFASVSHLVNSFKSEFNLTPKQYRSK